MTEKQLTWSVLMAVVISIIGFVAYSYLFRKDAPVLTPLRYVHELSQSNEITKLIRQRDYQE